MIDIEVTIKDKAYEDILSKDTCKNVVNKAYTLISDSYPLKIDNNADNIVMSILITDDEEIQFLNKTYRGIDNTTDVLSFAFDDDDSDKDVHFPVKELGEIVISYPYLLRNASEANVNKDNEAKRLLVHGLLHLLGYNHLTNDFDKEDMLILQEEILKKIEE